jgi:hypothetical protein
MPSERRRISPLLGAFCAPGMGFAKTWVGRLAGANSGRSWGQNRARRADKRDQGYERLLSPAPSGQIGCRDLSGAGSISRGQEIDMSCFGQKAPL